jgi:hypothetical protein
MGSNFVGGTSGIIQKFHELGVASAEALGDVA